MQEERLMSKKFMKVACLILAMATMITALTGCGKDNVMGGITAASLANANDVKEFYAEELKYTDIIQRTTQYVEDTIEFMEMSEADKKELIEKVGGIQAALNQTTYTSDKYLTMQMFENIRSTLGDKFLENGKCKDAKKTRDMYIIDMEYDIKFMPETGAITGEAKYLGVHGVFKRKSDGTAYLDSNFLARLSEKHASTLAEEQARAAAGVAGAVGDENIVNTGHTYIDNVSENLAKYNNVFGSSLSEIAIMPSLDHVFWRTGCIGQLSGIAIRKEGANGLNEFGFDRNSMSGKAVVRYIFKKDSETQIKNFDNVYVLEYKFEKGVPAFEKTDIFPEFAERAIGTSVERADRAICNGDIAGMSNGKIFGNKSFAVENGNKQLATIQVKYGSKITEYTKRNNRLWLIKVETNSTEEVKYANKGPATYRDTKYICLEQLGNSFILVDSMTISREPLTEPELNYADNNENRYTYLYNSGNVSDESKKNIKEFMKNYYQYCSNKDNLNMAKSFSKDTSMVSKEKRSEMYYEAKGLVDKAEGDSKPDYKGAITEWLGGSSDPQVEFTTIELCKLPNGKALEITKYYLVSVFNDAWVIDDMKELSSKELTAAEDIKSVENDIAGYNK